MNTSLARVVLIGGSGFIGRAIDDELSRSQVLVLNLDSKKLDLVEPISASLLKKMIKETDSIIMLAALTPDRGNDPVSLVQNIQMLDSVLKAISEISVRHFIYFSSDAVYGTQDGLISESSNLNPSDPYGAMHVSRETMLGKISHIPTMILRPTMVYGLGDTHNAYGPNRFVKTSKMKNEIALFGEGEELRDYIAVEDVAMITKLILQNKYVGVLNLATGSSVTFKSIANVINENNKHLISITRMQRVNKIYHRHFDVTNLIRMYPGFKFRKLDDYLRSC